MYRSLSIIGVFFLLGLTAVPGSSGAEQEDRSARRLVNAQGCKACHTLEGDGGTLAGSFADMRAKLSRHEVRLQLVNPTGRHGNNTIPDFSHLTEKEIEVLIVFIQPKL